MTKPKQTDTAPLVEFNPKDFAHHLEGFEIIEEQADELIRALAEIMLAFVDLGFGIAPSQQSCGQQDLAERFLAGGLSNMVNSSEPSDTNQQHAAEEGV